MYFAVCRSHYDADRATLGCDPATETGSFSASISFDYSLHLDVSDGSTTDTAFAGGFQNPDNASLTDYCYQGDSNTTSGGSTGGGGWFCVADNAAITCPIGFPGTPEPEPVYERICDETGFGINNATDNSTMRDKPWFFSVYLTPNLTQNLDLVYGRKNVVRLNGDYFMTAFYTSNYFELDWNLPEPYSFNMVHVQISEEKP